MNNISFYKIAVEINHLHLRHNRRWIRKKEKKKLFRFSFVSVLSSCCVHLWSHAMIFDKLRYCLFCSIEVLFINVVVVIVVERTNEWMNELKLFSLIIYSSLLSSKWFSYYFFLSVSLTKACIDDNFEMVEFLVQHGADINKQDNEGWTPLHATASCGWVSILSL